VIAVVAVCFFCLREQEPSYNGRTLSEWLEIYNTTWPYDRFGNRYEGADEAQQKEALIAVQKIGTNAIPYLLKWVSAKGSRGREAFDTVLDKLPERIFLFIGPEVTMNLADRKRGRAGNGFQILDTNAAAAVPELRQLFNSGNYKTEIQLPAYCLRCTGSAGLNVLAAAICDNETNAQCIAALDEIGHIKSFDTNAEPVINALLHGVDAKSILVSRKAIGRLGHLAIYPERVVPVLAKRFGSTNVYIRTDVVRALSRFGTNADSALPVIEAALNDDDEIIRETAKLALLVIEGRTNTASVTN
jgi:hypothetical protein